MKSYMQHSENEAHMQRLLKNRDSFRAWYEYARFLLFNSDTPIHVVSSYAKTALEIELNEDTIRFFAFTCLLEACSGSINVMQKQSRSNGLQENLLILEQLVNIQEEIKLCIDYLTCDIKPYKPNKDLINSSFANLCYLIIRMISGKKLNVRLLETIIYEGKFNNELSYVLLTLSANKNFPDNTHGILCDFFETVENLKRYNNHIKTLLKINDEPELHYRFIRLFLRYNNYSLPSNMSLEYLSLFTKSNICPDIKDLTVLRSCILNLGYKSTDNHWRIFLNLLFSIPSESLTIEEKTIFKNMIRQGILKDAVFYWNIFEQMDILQLLIQQFPNELISYFIDNLDFSNKVFSVLSNVSFYDPKEQVLKNFYDLIYIFAYRTSVLEVDSLIVVRSEGQDQFDCYESKYINGINYFIAVGSISENSIYYIKENKCIPLKDYSKVAPLVDVNFDDFLVLYNESSLQEKYSCFFDLLDYFLAKEDIRRQKKQYPPYDRLYDNLFNKKVRNIDNQESYGLYEGYYNENFLNSLYPKLFTYFSEKGNYDNCYTLYTKTENLDITNVKNIINALDPEKNIKTWIQLCLKFLRYENEGDKLTGQEKEILVNYALQENIEDPYLVKLIEDLFLIWPNSERAKYLARFYKKGLAMPDQNQGRKKRINFILQNFNKDNEVFEYFLYSNFNDSIVDINLLQDIVDFYNYFNKQSHMEIKKWDFDLLKLIDKIISSNYSYYINSFIEVLLTLCKQYPEFILIKSRLLELHIENKINLKQSFYKLLIDYLYVAAQYKYIGCNYKVLKFVFLEYENKSNLPLLIKYFYEDKNLKEQLLIALINRKTADYKTEDWELVGKLLNISTSSTNLSNINEIISSLIKKDYIKPNIFDNIFTFLCNNEQGVNVLKELLREERSNFYKHLMGLITNKINAKHHVYTLWAKTNETFVFLLFCEDCLNQKDIKRLLDSYDYHESYLGIHDLSNRLFACEVLPIYVDFLVGATYKEDWRKKLKILESYVYTHKLIDHEIMKEILTILDEHPNADLKVGTLDIIFKNASEEYSTVLIRILLKRELNTLKETEIFCALALSYWDDIYFNKIYMILAKNQHKSFSKQMIKDIYQKLIELDRLSNIIYDTAFIWNRNKQDALLNFLKQYSTLSYSQLNRDRSQLEKIIEWLKSNKKIIGKKFNYIQALQSRLEKKLICDKYEVTEICLWNDENAVLVRSWDIDTNNEKACITINNSKLSRKIYSLFGKGAPLDRQKNKISILEILENGKYAIFEGTGKSLDKIIPSGGLREQSIDLIKKFLKYFIVLSSLDLTTDNCTPGSFMLDQSQNPFLVDLETLQPKKNMPNKDIIKLINFIYFGDYDLPKKQSELKINNYLDCDNDIDLLFRPIENIVSNDSLYNAIYNLNVGEKNLTNIDLVLGSFDKYAKPNLFLKKNIMGENND